MCIWVQRQCRETIIICYFSPSSSILQRFVPVIIKPFTFNFNFSLFAFIQLQSLAPQQVPEIIEEGARVYIEQEKKRNSDNCRGGSKQEHKKDLRTHRVGKPLIKQAVNHVNLTLSF